jgi:hypothetical protein
MFPPPHAGAAAAAPTAPAAPRRGHGRAGWGGGVRFGAAPPLVRPPLCLVGASGPKGVLGLGLPAFRFL